MITGAFIKRLVMVGWALTGLIAVALYSGKLSDATYIWGTMTQDLLGVGFVGLMIASVLAANMASKASSSLEWSAAFTKNILVPLRPASSEKTQILVGRIVIFLVLMAGIGFAYMVDDIFVVFKYVLSIGTIIGPLDLARLFLAQAHHESSCCTNVAFYFNYGRRTKCSSNYFLTSITFRPLHKQRLAGNSKK